MSPVNIDNCSSAVERRSLPCFEIRNLTRLADLNRYNSTEWILELSEETEPGQDGKPCREHSPRAIYSRWQAVAVALH